MSNYTPRNQKYNEAKNKLLKNATDFFRGREKIIEGFKNGIFLLNHDNKFEEEQQTSKKFNKKEPPIKPTKTDANELNELIIKKETSIGKELFINYFKFETPTLMLKTLYNLNDRKKNNLLVNTIKRGLNDLKNEIRKMSEDEIKNEKPHKIVDIVKRILDFNRQNQRGQGLKILTPNQMLSRLPISLTHLKARNNSEKVKNEIRQLLYSLYRSKKTYKTNL